MSKSRLLVVLLTIFVSFCALACDDDGKENKGTAPTITNLTHDSTILTVQVQGIINGTFDFSDPDADLDVLELDVVMPDGQTPSTPDTSLAGVKGVEAETINWSLVSIPPIAGTYDFTLRVVDEEGNESNELAGSFEAE